jgi:hypothetical protein
MRQGCEIVDGISSTVDVGCELAVGDAGTSSDSFRFWVEFDPVKVFQRYLIFGAVGNVIKGVTRTEGSEMGAACDAMLHIFNCVWKIEIFGTVYEVSSPISAAIGGCLRGADLWKQATGK